jgi:hypothetical protein
VRRRRSVGVSRRPVDRRKSPRRGARCALRRALKILPKRFAGRIFGTHPPPATPPARPGYASPDRRRHPSSAPSLARRLPGITFALDGR